MALYCDHEVRFRGRLLVVRCRYNTPQVVDVIKGKPLPELTNFDFYYETPTGLRKKVMRALLKLLRRQSAFTKRGHCQCQFPDY